ncbi:TonB-dependent receptor [Sphingomonas nostoxanthinifaciens]|uniref:TonB-dependent receptor n=1 Tax=Sphingomonas nostoxanthinifaciens TaxID=2872652 RepID=UPI001CC1CF30|nr:TonB-dependent receptor [Sphingomonas nostoxanthinifaciens]UAK23001.1 TonB-dependent receptor [Sphingomonas nostoxanthinifaciens]
MLAASSRHDFAVPAGSLGGALALLARQAGIDIGGTDAQLDRIVSRGVNGSLTTDHALGRLLAGTPFAAQMVGPGTYRLVVRAAPRPAAAAPPPPPDRDRVRLALTSQPRDSGSGEIVIRGGKRDLPLATYPGSATVIVLGGDALGPHGVDSQDYLLRQSPILQSTELGTGRDKYFIRGVADSSFTGPTQATAGTYFGEVRTAYSGPDPNLNLYDVERVEILEGPQGALYGAGSLGGVIRLSPHPAVLDAAEASAEVGVSSTAHGGIGYDTAGMVNYAPWRDRVAIRLVAYRTRTAGYIDDPGRGLSDINPLTESGGRAVVRVRPADGWTIDLGGIIQTSHEPDLQYALADRAPLTRMSAVPQPFEDNYKMGRVIVIKQWSNGLRFVSATARVSHDFDQRFDATRIGHFNIPIVYDEHDSIRLTTQEARLSRTMADGDGWLVGVAYVHDTTGKSRQFGTLTSPRELIGVTDRTQERSAFASGTFHLFDGLLVSGGLRYTSARMDGDPSTTSRGNYIRGQTTSRADPQVGVSYRLTRRLVSFVQYQQGFRTGGLAVSNSVGRVQNYEDDKLYVGEAGLRLVRTGTTGLAAVAAVSYAKWKDIQADLISNQGFPYTDNVGDGRIVAFEGTLDWVPVAALRLTGGLFLNRSRLTNPRPAYIASGSRPLPDTPPVSATGSATWSHQLGTRTLQLRANMRYVGSSRLGVGPVLDLPYGNYVETGAAASLKLARYTLSLGVDNLADVRGNRFAVGNPFGIAQRDEVTPLRPRTVRLGASASF